MITGRSSGVERIHDTWRGTGAVGREPRLRPRASVLGVPMLWRHHVLIAALALLPACSGAAKAPVRQSEAEHSAAPLTVEAKVEAARAGHVDPDLIPSLTAQTQRKMEAGDFQAAVQTAEPLVQMMEIVHGPNAVQTAPSLEVLADIYCNLKRCAESVALLERARDIYRAGGEPTKVAYIRTLNSLGAIWYVLGEPARAEPVLKESLAQSEARFGANSTQAGIACSLLANIYKAEGKTADAAAMKARADKLIPAQPAGKRPQ
jgi:tetratricopeptide (TPR) repeat protein